MKGLGVNRNRHVTDSCDPASSLHHREALYPPKSSMGSSTLPRSPYLLAPAAVDRYGTMDPRLYPSNPASLTPDCVLNNQIPNSSTFPGMHYNTYDPHDFSPPESLGGMGTLGTSLSLGMQPGMGMSSLRTPMITSGSATISHHGGKGQIPQSLLEFDKMLPGGRDGFSTLQFHRTTAAIASSKQRTDSPGRIRYMLNSVQKLFAKSQSLEGQQMKGNVNGRSSASGGGSSSAEDGGKQNRRAKSKDRATKEPKRRPRSNMSGYWSSDDLDSSDVSSYHHTMGRLGAHEGLQSPQQRYIHSGYNTISSSKSSGDMKFSVPGRGEPGLGLGSLGVADQDYVKGGSWSALTMGQPPRQQLLQQGAHTLDRSMFKSKSCQQELSTNYLQVGRRHDWSSSLGRGQAMGGAMGRAMEIPCRRMRSGSYVKAMGDTADSDDSDFSPKPSPKCSARRQSYLRATQQSLSDQLPLRNCLPSLQELSSPHALDQTHPLGGDRLDSLGGTVSSGWDDEDLREAVSSLARRSHMGQLRDLDSGRFEDHSSESTFRDSRSQSQDSPPDLPRDLPRDLPPDLPRPSCFRSRSHSYLRAIQAGCSQDEDSLSLDSTSPPPTESSVRTYSTSTVSTCVSTCKRTAPPPVPPRTTSKPYISVTVQSSTESAQDTYLEREEGRRSEVTSQSSQAHSNSSDSLDSTRANSLARGIRRPPQITAVARETNRETNREHRETLTQRETREAMTHRESREPLALSRAHAATETTNCDSAAKAAKASLTLTGVAKANVSLTPEELQEAPAPRRKLSSIGIQVDCLQEASGPAPQEDTPPLSRFQSIGVQVEDGWQLSRSSSMTSKQETDSDTQEVPPPLYKPQLKPSEKKVMVSCGSQSVAQDSLDQEEPVPSTTPITRQILNRSTTRSSSDSFSESLDPSLDPALDPSCLPPPDPWLESTVSGGGGALIQGGAGGMGGNLCRRDGQWFLKLLEAERGRMEGWCEQMEQETQDHQLSAEVLGKVRSAVGSAQLLMSQKFQQFQGLCEQNLDPLSSSRPSLQDLAGFWDLLQISIEDISLKFDELYHLKSSEWQPLERKDHQQRAAAAAAKKPAKRRSSLGREKSVDLSSSGSADKPRQEARKRLVTAKKATSFRQNSATESADSLEMYVPEAQTRL
ncbi:disks large-associated protein 4-like isoform X2 [Eucyclogobius newberryi]|uniref:disks large-associated protein 4-like isoform X2 n=1 Tax=Eucyclogobius newberryi TaxID=166745 RepID=UPI003B5BE77A